MPTGRSRLGSLGERRALEYLGGAGYRIIETNYRCRWGEVDIVARNGDFLVFVEVKTRRSHSYGSPEESVTKAKAQRLIAAAETYLEERQTPAAQWRIDLVSVEMDRGGRVKALRHLQNAIEGPPAS